MRHVLTGAVMILLIGILPALSDPVVSPTATKVPLPTAFSFSAQDVAAAITEGQKQASKHQSRPDIMKAFEKNPHWTRGLGQGSTDNSVVVFNTYRAHDIAIMSFDAAANYNKLDLPPSLLANGGSYAHLDFHVILMSGMSIKRTRVQFGNKDDVVVQKFVLTDDKNDVLTADAPSTNGTDISTKITTLYPGSRTRKLVSDLFVVRYEATFSIQDAQGSSLIAPDATTLTLHIITPFGEQSVDYKMADLK